jgi:NAD+ kinase
MPAGWASCWQRTGLIETGILLSSSKTLAITIPTHIGLLHHPKKPESLILADEMRRYLVERACQVWSGSAWDEPRALAQVADLDLLITLGGDGTMLRAARIGSSYGVPILGIKLGRVSFLGEVAPDNWQEPLGRMLAGDFWLEDRMLLDVVVTSRDAAPDAEAVVPPGNAHTAEPAVQPDVFRSPVPLRYLALNDVVITRGGLARLITVDAWVDQSYLARYRADGVIVSTPTGCTGYALAADGPILPPELKNILLIPICPHLSLDRPIVLSQGATVTLRVEAEHPPILTVDGQFEVTLAEGDRVDVRASEHVSQFVHMQDRAYFYRTLMERLRW